MFKQETPKTEKINKKPNYDDLDSLESMTTEARLAVLAKKSSSLTISSSDLRQYFQKYPQDLDFLASKFKEQKGVPQTTQEHNLYSLSIELIIKHYSQIASTREAQRFLNIGENRKIAPNYLLDNYKKEDEFNIDEYEEVSDGFLNSIKKASDLTDLCITREDIFNDKYEQLSEEKKADFLRKCLARLQYALVYNEISGDFNAEDTKRQKEKYHGAINQGFPKMINPRHSILYKTYQPQSVYDLSLISAESRMGKQSGYGEYNYHKLILLILDELKNIKTEQKQNSDLVVDFWNKNRHPFFGSKVAEVLSNQDPNYSAKKILELLKKEKGDKNALTSILYRIELGKISISNEGVQYLEQIYDLGEYNNPDYSAERLTSDGEIGIFQEQELIKFFKLDLESELKNIKAKVLDFTYQTLFLEKDNESEEEKNRRLKYLEEFKKNYQQIAQLEIFKDSDVSLNNLSFKEQSWFIMYYNSADEQEKKRLKNLVQNHGEKAIKTFLALDMDENKGADILLIGEKTKKTTAENIFKRYNEITDIVLNSMRKILEEYGYNNMNNEQIKIVSQHLFKKANCLLSQLAEKIRTDETPKNKEIIDLLNDYRSDILTTFSIYKTLKNELDIEDLQGVTFEQLDLEKLETIKDEIIALGNEEYKDQPDNDNENLTTIEELFSMYDKTYAKRPEFKKRLKQSFAEALINGKELVLNIIKKDGKAVAFNRVESSGDGKKIFGSFNILPSAQALSIGKALFNKTAEREFVDFEVSATCDAFSVSSFMYIEDGKFVVEKIDQESDPDNIAWFAIRKEKDSSYQYQNLDKEELVAEVSEDVSDKNAFVLAFENNPDEIIEKIGNLINEQNFKITRCFLDNDKVYLAFEK